MYDKTLERATEARTLAQTNIDALRASFAGRAPTDSERRTLADLEDERRVATDAALDAANRMAHTAKLDEARSRFEGTLRAGDISHASEERASDGWQEVADTGGAFGELVRGERRSMDLPTPSQVAEVRALNTDVAAEGGELVPTMFASAIYTAMEAQAGLLGAADVISTPGGAPLNLPVGSIDDAAVIISEGGTISDSDPSFTSVELGAFKYATLLLVSAELYADSVNGLGAYLGAELGNRIGRGLGPHLATGDGTNKPTGLVTAAATGVTAAAAVTADELVDLQHAVASQYRPGASWAMNDATLGVLRKLKDADGRFLLEPSLAAGIAPTLLGHRVVVDAYMPDISTAASPIAFGDLSKFKVRQAGPVRIERSDHYAFDSDQVAWRALARYDSKLIDAAAVKLLTMS